MKGNGSQRKEKEQIRYDTKEAASAPDNGVKGRNGRWVNVG